MRDKEHAANRLAARQHRVISLRQLARCGFTRQAVGMRVQTGRLWRRYRGVYVVGPGKLTANGEWMAAVLACGPTAVLSHRAALALWEIRPPLRGPIDITAVRSGGRSKPGIHLHTTGSLPPEDRMVFDAIPVTSPARALHDYARTADPEELRTALEAAERLDRLDGIEDILHRAPNRRLTEAYALLTGTPPQTRSELERTFLALVREAGLPEPQINVIVLGKEVDAYWPAHRLIVELDSWSFHRTRSQFEEDRRRDVQRQLAGLRAIRLTDRRMTRERTAVQDELRALLAGSNLL